MRRNPRRALYNAHRRRNLYASKYAGIRINSRDILINRRCAGRGLKNLPIRGVKVERAELFWCYARGRCGVGAKNTSDVQFERRGANAAEAPEEVKMSSAKIHLEIPEVFYIGLFIVAGWRDIILRRFYCIKEPLWRQAHSSV